MLSVRQRNKISSTSECLFNNIKVLNIFNLKHSKINNSQNKNRNYFPKLNSRVFICSVENYTFRQCKSKFKIRFKHIPIFKVLKSARN